MRCAEALDWMIERKYVVQLTATEKSYRNYLEKKVRQTTLNSIFWKIPKYHGSKKFVIKMQIEM